VAEAKEGCVDFAALWHRSTSLRTCFKSMPFQSAGSIRASLDNQSFSRIEQFDTENSAICTDIGSNHFAFFD
jgi:hypothetical protein